MGYILDRLPICQRKLGQLRLIEKQQISTYTSQNIHILLNIIRYAKNIVKKESADSDG